MGRIQSSVGLISGTDIAGVVDQLVAISAQPRDRLVARTELLQRQQGSIAELTALVIGVQLAGNRLASPASFRSRSVESSNAAAVSAAAGSGADVGQYVVRTLQTAATHSIRSVQRIADVDQPLGYEGTLRIRPAGGFLDESALLSELNGGRGVQAGVIRITDRAGKSAEIDTSQARTIDDLLSAINDANIDVRATTTGNAITLTDDSGQTASNLRVEQLGDAETAADLGLWGIDSASNTVTGIELELPAGVSALRGVALTELAGGGALGPLTNLDITLADGSSASIDLSAAETTADVIDAINNSGLSVIARLNDARNGFQIRDVSGGGGNLVVSSADETAARLGIEADTTDDIVVGENLYRQSVTLETKLADLNGGDGVGKGTFTITDSSGQIGVVNLALDQIETVGQLIEKINELDISVTAALNETGDGIAVIDNAAGSAALVIEDTGGGLSAQQLGLAGTASEQSFGGETVSAVVGTQAARIEITADDTLTTIVEKINESGRYATAGIEPNEDGSFSLRIRGAKGGEQGRIAVNTDGFDLDLRTETTGRDARIAVSSDGGIERFQSSSDGVFDLSQQAGTNRITAGTRLSEIGGPAEGSFTITDSSGNVGAVNIRVDQLETVGQLIDRINSLGIGVTAAINESGNGIQVVDTAGGTGTLSIEDFGASSAAASLNIAGEAKEVSIDGQIVSAVVGSSSFAGTSGGGLVLTLKELADAPITVSVGEDISSVTANAQSLVNQYNLLVDKLDSLTQFNADTNEVGLLFGSNEALRVRSGFSRLLSGRISSAGKITSIGQVGLRLNEQGKLELQRGKLESALAENPSDVENFFTTEAAGLVDRLSDLADRLAGDGNSLLLGRTETLSSQVLANNDRIEAMNLRLDRERERLLAQFVAMEAAIARIQSNQAAIDSIQPITIPS